MLYVTTVAGRPRIVIRKGGLQYVLHIGSQLSTDSLSMRVGSPEKKNHNQNVPLGSEWHATAEHSHLIAPTFSNAPRSRVRQEKSHVLDGLGAPSMRRRPSTPFRSPFDRSAQSQSQLVPYQVDSGLDSPKYRR
jgi:hypothetical protein